MRIFICNNKRRPPQPSCGKRCDTAHFSAYLQQKLDEHEASSGETVQVMRTKCLGRCLVGPALVVFPDKVWYTYAGEGDIDEIVSEHIVAGRPVQRLMLGGTPVRTPERARVGSS
jgi:(2Fe-2S) ferredoxin